MFLLGLAEKKMGEVIAILAEEDISLVMCRDFAISEDTNGSWRRVKGQIHFRRLSPTQKRR